MRPTCTICGPLKTFPCHTCHVRALERIDDPPRGWLSVRVRQDADFAVIDLFCSRDCLTSFLARDGDLTDDPSARYLGLMPKRSASQTSARPCPNCEGLAQTVVKLRRLVVQQRTREPSPTP